MSGTGKTTKVVAYTGSQIVDAMLDGTAWGGSTITYAFPTQASAYSYAYEASNGFGAVSAEQVNAALFTLEQDFGLAANDGFSVEGFTAIAFASGSDASATVRLAQSTAANPTAYAYMPGLYRQAGDVWFGTNYNYTNPVAGNYAWHTLMHEIGHALGLKHGHETDGAGALPTDRDSIEYSIMTYRSYVGAGTGGYSYEGWGAPQTFMMADIAALQEMYGADYTTNSGNTVYAWTPSSGNTLVNGQVAIAPGGNRIFATIWDGGGKDTYDLSAYTASVEIDLRAGGDSTFSTAQLARLGWNQYAHGNIFNALLHDGDLRSLIEHAIGGSGNDTIVGNQVANRLNGGSGSDRLEGLAGADVLFGGLNGDTFVFSAGHGRDIVRDFVNSSDIIDLSATAIGSIGEALANAVQTRAAVVLTTGSGDAIVLRGVTLGQLDAGDFIFA